MTSQKKLVSLILAVRNEAAHIEAALNSLREQEQADFEMEILVVDGCSNDGTREKVEAVARLDPRIRFLHNEKKNTPAAFNIGLKEARGDYVCIMGAHTQYDRDYIAICLREVLENGAVGCSGKIITRPGAATWMARLIAACLSHPFGTSTRSVRTQPPGISDTISYPVFRKAALLEVGGYDPTLHRNQDNDMSGKLRARGYKLWLTDKTHCQYFVSSTIRSLLQFGSRTGYWNIISLRKNRSAMGWRHFVPFFFLISLLATGLWPLLTVLGRLHLGIWLWLPFVIVLGSHLLLGTLAGIQIAVREKSVTGLLAPAIFMGLHVAYGMGTLWAVLRNARSPEVASEAI